MAEPNAAPARSPRREPAASRLDLLQAFYGEEAPGFLVIWRKGTKRSHWVSADQLDQATTLQTDDDLYFGVALHDQERALELAATTDAAQTRGCSESTVALPGLWADIDVRGPAHSRDDLPPSFEAAHELIARFPLPPTVVVHSGHGLQVFWLFKELWVFEDEPERGEARRLSRQFQATLQELARELGWKIDETSDLARLLRLPGTFNTKTEERRLVEIVGWYPENRYDPSEFERCLVGEFPGPRVAQGGAGVDTAATLAGVPEGQRDTALFRLASKLRRADVPRDCAERLVIEAAGNCQPPFPEQEALAKVASAYIRYRPSVGFVSSLDAWDGPFSELPPARLEAPPLPADLLPQVLRRWLLDISERMQVPLELAATPALVGLASVVGRRAGIHPKQKDTWLVVPNLWGGVIASPGRLKSPTLAEALRPVRRLAALAREEHERQALETETRLSILKTQETATRNRLRKAFEGRKSQGEPGELEERLRRVHQEIRELERGLVERRYVVNDATVEKLGELLALHPLGLLLERDELAGWLRSLEREDRKGDREFFLEAWNGTNPYTYDRIGRGTIHISALCLSIVGGIQPTKLARFVSEALDGGYAADGLLQRFQLLVWPEDDGHWELVDRSPDAEALETVCGVVSALDTLDLGDQGGALGTLPTLRFAEDAQQLFYDWLSNLEGRLRSSEVQRTPAFEGHLSKYRSLMPSLALLFHLVETVERGPVGAVSLEATKRAADWCDYLELHARKVYCAELQGDLIVAHAVATKIKGGQIYDGMKVRDIYRPGWSHLKTPEAVSAALELLELHGWLRVVVPEGKGRPSPEVRINPELLGGAA